MNRFHLLSIRTPTAIEASGERTAYIVPYAEDGTGNRCHGIGSKMKRGKRTGKTRVLHTHLDADGDAFPELHLYQLGNREPEEQATDVVEHHHENDQQAT